MKKTILIIGANSDIAKEIAKKYLKKGNFLHLFTRNKEILLNSEKALFDKNNVKIQNFSFDDISNFTSMISNLSPKPEVSIIANGYMGNNKDSIENIKEVFDINFIHIAQMCNHIVTYYKLNKIKGNLSVISSVAGIKGRAKNYIYGSSKSAINTYLSGLRQKYSNEKICITTIILGFVNTKMNKGLELNKILLSEPDEIAKKIINAIEDNKEIYIPFLWRVIILILLIIPEKLFKKLKF